MYCITTDREMWVAKKRAARVMSRRVYDLSRKLAGGNISPQGRSEKTDKADRYKRRAERIGSCAHAVSSRVCPHCNIRYIFRVNLCRDRLCPVCAWRRGKALAARLRRVVSYNVARNSTNPPRYLFLTLTVKNCEWGKLRENIARMMEGWKKLSRRVAFRRAVLGWTRTFEVTRGRDGRAHPHFHVLLEVPPEYFEKDGPLYLEHDALVRLWAQCLAVDYSPSVDIRAVKWGKVGGAIAEVTKYLAKGVDIEGLDDTDFAAYADAIAGVRAWACGGSFREADEEMEADELLHTESQGEEHDPRCDCPLCGRELLEVLETWDDTVKSYVITRNERIDEWENCAPSRAGPIYVVNNGGVVNIGEAACVWNTSPKVQTRAV